MPELYTQVMLTRDLPEHQLARGDLAVLVDYLDHPHGGEQGAVLEVFTLTGESIAVVTVPISAITAPQGDFIPAARAR